MFRWFPNSTSLICLLESWRRQPFAGQPKPRPAGRRIRVGLPTPAKSQKMDRKTLPWCSLPSNSSHPRAFSHCLNNRISKQAHKCSQPIHWTSHRLDWLSTSFLGTTRSRQLRMPWVSTSQPGTMRHHSQGDDLNSNVIVNAQLTHLISRDDAAQGQDAPNVSSDARRTSST